MSAPVDPLCGVAAKARGSKMTKSGKSKTRGWITIAIVALATLLFFVLGTMDADLRYDLIGL